MSLLLQQRSLIIFKIHIFKWFVGYLLSPTALLGQTEECCSNTQHWHSVSTLRKETIYFWAELTSASWLSIVRDNKYWRGKVHFQTVPPPLISVKSRPVCSVSFVERMAFFTFDRLDFLPGEVQSGWWTHSRGRLSHYKNNLEGFFLSLLTHQALVHCVKSIRCRKFYCWKMYFLISWGTTCAILIE